MAGGKQKEKAVTAKRWSWKDGAIAKYRRTDADKVGEELEELEKREGVIKPEAIITLASNPQSAMHGLFTWDDYQAAEKYRRVEAGALLRAIRVVHIIVGKRPEEDRVVNARVFVRPATADGYKSIENIKSYEEKVSIVEKARRDLEAWMARYEDLNGQLEEIFKEVRAKMLAAKAA